MSKVTKGDLTKLNPRGAALFVVALILSFVILAARGLTWQFWAMIGLCLSGLIFFFYSVQKYGNWVDEEEKKAKQAAETSPNSQEN